MHVQVRYFAAAREAAGTGEEPLELAEDVTVADAFRVLVERPPLAPLADRLRFAVDAAFVHPDARLAAGATLALIPPVGGG